MEKEVENKFCKWNYFLIFILIIFEFSFISFDINLISAQNYYNDYSDVLLVCNNASSASIEICNYFISKRLSKNFNMSHVVNLTGISTAETVDCSVYNSIRDQINASFQTIGFSSVNYILTTKGVPLRACSRSVDSMLAYYWGDNEDYFNKEDIFSHGKYGGYLVTRLDGVTAQDAKNLIDNSDLATLNGYFLINKYSTSYSQYDQDCTPAYNYLVSKSLSAELNNSLFVTNRRNLSGYWSWGSNSGSNSNSTAWNLSFNPGAIGETAVSTSARTLASLWPGNGQSLISDLIRMNITGIKGYVYEPYLDSIASPEILFKRYSNGYNLADSYYMASSARDWMDVIIGDPKTYITTASLNPSVTLNHPISGERINNGTLINLSIYSTRFSSISYVWYNYNGTNISLSTPYTMDTTNWSYGSYNVSVYVNDSIGKLGAAYYSFIINNTIGITPSYDKFNGNTTNLKTLPDKTNVSNLIMEQTSMGKIEFLENSLNVSGLDLDKNIIFTSSSVFLNSTALINLNVSANISLYNSQGINYKNPVILRDGVVCNSTTTPKCHNLTALNATTVVFNVTSFSTYQILGDLVTNCINLNQANTYYTLVNNVTSNSTCFNITATNITLDGNGYSINYSANGSIGYGVYVFGQNNFSLKNIKVYETNSSGNEKQAIYLKYSNDSIIYNNSIFTLGSYSYGINLYSALNSNVTSNIIFTNGSFASGIYLYSSFNSTLTSNNISTNGSSGSGISFYSASSSNTVSFNTISTTGSSGSGFYSDGYSGYPTRYNNIISNNISTRGFNGYGIYLMGSSNNYTVASNLINVSNADRILLEAYYNFDLNFFVPENNTIINNTIVNRNYSYSDINFSGSGFIGSYLPTSMKRNTLIDQYLENYTFAGAGAEIQIKNSQFGEIIFISAVNKSGTNFSYDIQISNNSVYINSLQSGINRSANITFYNLLPTNGYSYQKILRDGIECNSTTSSVCINLTSLTDTNVTFNVTSWSNYSIYRGEDTDLPVVSLFSPLSGTSYSGSSYTVNFIFNATDNSGIITNCSAYIAGNRYTNTSINNSNNNTINVVLSSGSYSAYVNCTDSSENTGSSSTISFTITPAEETTSSGSGGGGSSIPTTKDFWQVTHDITYIDLTPGYSENLAYRERAKINLSFDGSNKTYFVGVIKSEKTYVIINFSNSQSSKLYIGNLEKFDLNNDGKYDVSVKLTNISNNKANFIIQKINETIIPGKSDLVKVVNVTSENNEKPPKENIDSTNYSLIIVLSIIAVIVMVAIITFIYFLTSRSKKIKIAKGIYISPDPYKDPYNNSKKDPYHNPNSLK